MQTIFFMLATFLYILYVHFYSRETSAEKHVSKSHTDIWSNFITINHALAFMTNDWSHYQHGMLLH